MQLSRMMVKVLRIDKMEGLISRLVGIGVDVMEIDQISALREVLDDVAVRRALQAIECGFEDEIIGVAAAGEVVSPGRR